MYQDSTQNALHASAKESSGKRPLDAPEWAVMRCAGKGERCGSTGTCVPVDSANGLTPLPTFSQGVKGPNQQALDLV